MNENNMDFLEKRMAIRDANAKKQQKKYIESDADRIFQLEQNIIRLEKETRELKRYNEVNSHPLQIYRDEGEPLSEIELEKIALEIKEEAQIREREAILFSYDIELSWAERLIYKERKNKRYV